MTNGEESAFPEISDIPQFNSRTYGLTKREYFAAMALQGLLANQNLTNIDDATIAMTCIDAADALINALNQKP